MFGNGYTRSVSWEPKNKPRCPGNQCPAAPLKKSEIGAASFEVARMKPLFVSNDALRDNDFSFIECKGFPVSLRQEASCLLH
jgi:hypothetical protein